MNTCCICHKELAPLETFGPRRFPVCQQHKWEFEEALIEIDAMGISVEQDRAFAKLMGKSNLTSNQREIAELKEKISDWRDELEDLLDDVSYIEMNINDAYAQIKRLGSLDSLTKQPA